MSDNNEEQEPQFGNFIAKGFALEDTYSEISGTLDRFVEIDDVVGRLYKKKDGKATRGCTINLEKTNCQTCK